MDNKLEIFLTEEGYTDLKEVIWKDEVLVCGLRRFIFTTGLVIGMDDVGYKGRYCFETKSYALEALNNLTEIPEDPSTLDAEFIVYKG